MSRPGRSRAVEMTKGLVGLLDAAEILGWRRQSLWTELSRQERRRNESPGTRHDDDLPIAVGRVRATRLFLRSEYEAWALAHPERCPDAPAVKELS